MVTTRKLEVKMLEQLIMIPLIIFSVLNIISEQSIACVLA